MATNSFVYKSEVRLDTHTVIDDAIEAAERKVHKFTREPMHAITIHVCNDTVHEGGGKATILGINSFIEVFSQQL